MKMKVMKKLLAIALAACVCVGSGYGTQALAATADTGNKVAATTEKNDLQLEDFSQSLQTKISKSMGMRSVETKDEDVVVSDVIISDGITYVNTDVTSVKYWELNVSKPGTIYVQAYQVNDASAIAGVGVNICDANGKALRATDVRVSSYSNVEYATSFTVNKAGKYYIRTSNNYANTYGAVLVMREAGTVSTNTSKTKAATISPKQSKKGMIALNGASENWYTFKLSSEQRNSLSIYNESFDSNLYYQIITPSNSGLGNVSDIIPAGSTVTLDVYNPSKKAVNWPKGTYYVRVYRTDVNSSAAYTVSRKAYIAAMSIKSVSDRTYTEKSQKPSVTIKNGSTTLVKDRDYTLSYKNNKKVGKATITIKGKGGYEGSKTISFKIIPKGTKISKTTAGKRKLTVKWKKASSIDGYQVRYSTKSSMKSAKATKKISKKSTSTSISKLKKGKKYYVQVRTYKKVSGKYYYSKWSKAVKTKSVK